MKPGAVFVCSYFLTNLLLISPPPGRGQTYAIDRFTLHGGGSASTGGVYAVRGTVGQTEAATLGGGGFTVQGGLWPGLVVPAAAPAPTLFIQRSGDTVILSWSPATAGFALEATEDLMSPAWSAVTGVNPVTIPVDLHTRFYRLRKP
jgi:hypothetical protein